jgi:hypothetical protein
MKYLLCLIKLLALLNLSSSQEDYMHGTQTQDSLAELEKAAKEAESLDKLLNTENEALVQQLMKAGIQDDDGDDRELQDLEKLLNKQAENQQDEEPQQDEEEEAMAAQDNSDNVAKAQRSKRYYRNRMRMYRRYYLSYRRHYYQQRNLKIKYIRLYSVYHRSNTWCLKQLSRG